MENHQTAEGGVAIPDVLHGFGAPAALAGAAS